MNARDQWNQDNNDYRMPPGYPPSYGRSRRGKSKWLAGLLSFLIPGVGHMYVGKMIKAIFIMLMIAGVITGIVQVAIYGDNVLSIVLLSLLLPIIYFYSLFDAIQSADSFNERLAAEEWRGRQANQGYSNGVPPQPSQQSLQPQHSFPELRGIPLKKLVLLAIVVVFICLLAQQTWSEWKFDSTLSIIGAVLLIGAGFAMWIWELRAPQNPPEPRPQPGPEARNEQEP